MEGEHTVCQEWEKQQRLVLLETTHLARSLVRAVATVADIVPGPGMVHAMQSDGVDWSDFPRPSRSALECQLHVVPAKKRGASEG